MPYDTFGADRNLIQRIPDDAKIFSTSLGNHQPLPFAVEELDAECSLQRLDLLAHSTRCHIQFFSRSREALAPRRSLEGLDGVQRWQTTQHRLNLTRSLVDFLLYALEIMSCE